MLPYGKQSIDDDDIEAVAQCLRSDFLTTGPKVQEFEEALCALSGAKHAVVCSNGTTALHLASIALGLGPEDQVIVPSLTFLATANGPHYTGANVVFADVNPDTGLMEAHHFEDAITRCGSKKPRAVFPVHLTGQCVDSKSIQSIAKHHGIKVITDSCHALGGELYGSPVGSGLYDDMSVYSFHPVKTIAMGEGGAILTNNDEYAKTMRMARSHSMEKTPEIGPWAYQMEQLGYNYRASDIQCALGISQLKKLDGFIKRRRDIVALYDELLAPLAPTVSCPLRMEYSNPAWHLYALRIDFEAIGKSRADVMDALMERGVGTQVHYMPVHTQPYYRKLCGDLNLPGADRYYARTLSIPLYPSMRDEDVRHVVHALNEVIK